MKFVKILTQIFFLFYCYHAICDSNKMIDSNLENKYPSNNRNRAIQNEKMYSSNQENGLLLDLYNLLATVRNSCSDFSEDIVDNGRISIHNLGMLCVGQNDKFFWRLKYPNKQVIVADGKYIWFYDYDLEQIIKSKEDLSNRKKSSMPMYFLNYDNLKFLSRDYIFSKVSNLKDVVYDFKSISNTSLFQAIKFKFISNVLKEMIIITQNDTKMVMKFIKFNKINKDKIQTIFRFIPPKNITVFNN